MTSDKREVNLPILERCKKLFANLTRRSFFWFDFKYLPDHELSEIIFDYNSYFLTDLAELGYDVTNDPDYAVTEYVTNCIAATINEEDDD